MLRVGLEVGGVKMDKTGMIPDERDEFVALT